MLYLVEAKRGPATVCTVLIPEPFSFILGLMLLPQGEPLGLYRVSSRGIPKALGCLFSLRTAGTFLLATALIGVNRPICPFG